MSLLAGAPLPGAAPAGSPTDFDARHIWHPYAAATSDAPALVVRSAAGVRLHLDDGREVIDGMSSWWTAIHGYRHPVLDDAVRTQLDSMAHVMFGGLTHEPAIRLAERLVALTPAPLRHVFFSDSGSVAVEVALKMATQYWQARGETGRRRLLTVRGGYHGDTLGAMSVCDPVSGMHQLFAGLLPRQLFAPEPSGGVGRPVDDRWIEAVTSMLAAHAGEVSAVIVEPVVQGAGGMRFYDAAYVRVLRELCDAHDVLLILDEIATGFGRTGTLFAAEQAGIAPDIMCVGKAMTGGYLSMAATLCTADVAETISAGPGNALMHGPTFMGNPLAAAVAVASIDLLLSQDWAGEIRRIERGLERGLSDLRGTPGVRDVRVLGAIGVVQLEQPVDVTRATAAALDSGVWLRPFRDLVYAMPPYVSTDDDISAVTAGMAAAVRAAAA